MTPQQLGAQASVDAAVRSALSATPRSRIALPVTFSDDGRRRVTSHGSRSASSASRGARALLGANARGPRLPRRPARPRRRRGRRCARAIEQRARDRLARAARAGDERGRGRARTLASFGLDRRRSTAPRTRSSSTAATQLVRAFRVATGQSIYPTPSGIFRIVTSRLPVVVPAEYVVGEGPEAGPARARATRSARAGWAFGAGRRHPRHARRRVDRLLALARLHPHARLGRRVAVRARPASGRPS